MDYINQQQHFVSKVRKSSLILDEEQDEQLCLFPQAEDDSIKSSESLDLMLPQFHAKTEIQKNLLETEHKIVRYLKSYGIKMKTDPLLKQDSFYQYKFLYFSQLLEKSKKITASDLDDLTCVSLDSETNFEKLGVCMKQKFQSFLSNSSFQSQTPTKSPVFGLKMNPLVKRRQMTQKNNLIARSQYGVSQGIQKIAQIGILIMNKFQNLEDEVTNCEFEQENSTIRKLS